MVVETLNVSDETLERLVSEAADLLDMPLAFGAWTLESNVRYSAYFGFSYDNMSDRQALDRLLCVFVDDQASDYAEALNTRYGIQTCAGVPVDIDGKKVGYLCVADLQQRCLDNKKLDCLTCLARSISERLDHLQRLQRSHIAQLVCETMRPAFMELRNILTPVMTNISAGQSITKEITDSNLRTELEFIFLDLNTCHSRIVEVLEGLEGLHRWVPEQVPLSLVLQEARLLSSHITKLSGQFLLPTDYENVMLRTPRGLAVGSISNLVRVLADEHIKKGIRWDIKPRLEIEPEWVVIRLQSLTVFSDDSPMGRLCSLLPVEELISVKLIDSEVELLLRRA